MFIIRRHIADTITSADIVTVPAVRLQSVRWRDVRRQGIIPMMESLIADITIHVDIVTIPVRRVQ